MKKIVMYLVISALVISIFLSFLCHDIYVPVAKVIFCHDFDSCIHESTHKADDISGWTSSTNEWIDAVNDYRMVQYLMPAEFKDDHAFKIVFFPGLGKQKLSSDDPKSLIFWMGGWGGYTELYASIGEFSGGDINNIPPSLQQFYDMDEITEIMEGLGY